MHFAEYRKTTKRIFLICLIVATAITNVCQAQEERSDVIRVYWNPELTEVFEYTTSTSDTVTAYVVIENPSATAPVTRFEFILGMKYASFVGYESDLGPISTSHYGFGRERFFVYVSTPMVLGERTLIGRMKFRPSSLSMKEIEILRSSYFSAEGEIDLTTAFGVIESAWVNPGSPSVGFQPGPLEFGSLGLGSIINKSLRMYNSGAAPFFLSPKFEAGEDAFGLITELQQSIIAPSAWLDVELSFSPGEAREYLSVFTAGEGFSLALIGLGEEPQYSLAGPESAAFPSTAVGGREEINLLLLNDGNVPLVLAPTMLDSCLVMRLASSQTLSVLNPGATKNVIFEYWPTEVGADTCEVSLAGGVLVTRLTGISFAGTNSVSVTPPAVEFGEIGRGIPTSIRVDYRNQGDVVLYPSYQFSDATGRFTTATEPPAVLFPRGSATLYVSISEQRAGTYTGTLSLGPDMPSLMLSATVIEDAFSLSISPEILVFDPTNPGDTDMQVLEIINTGLYNHRIKPTTISGLVIDLPSGGTLRPGESMALPITYRPYEYGRFEFRIILNGEHSKYVDCVGTPVLGFADGQNRLGMFFDHELRENENLIEPEAQSVMAYLAMINISDESGVGGWECKINASPGAALVGYVLEGNTINASSGFEFTVGLGLEPLPYSSQVLLGSFEFVVYDLEQDEFRLSLTPTSTPSIPGMMSWAPWRDVEELMPMLPITGDSTVAWIRLNGPVANETPTPVAIANEDGVEMRWPNKAPADAGYNVYRRAKEGTPVQLNRELLVSDEPVMVFVDKPSGPAAHGVFYYSYRLVIGGLEVGESPEVEFQLGEQLPGLTRLRTNYPNPFNPQTTIAFDLSRASQVRIEIYDVTGRRVRSLENTQLVAGTFERVWLGRDDSGRSLPSGAYYVRMTTDTLIDTRKVMLLK